MIRSFLDTFMSQFWGDLLLLHWPVPSEILRSSIPDDVELDTFEGQAWVSVVGFHLSGLRIRPFRWLPWGDFNEVNLRTYVRDSSGKRGVWFYSLDSTDLFAVAGAKMLYGLNYRYASISQNKKSDRLTYNSSTRSFSKQIHANFTGQLSLPFELNEQANAPLDQFLLERYCFWAKRSWQKCSTTAVVRHRPYNGYRLENSSYKGKLFECHGIPEPRGNPALTHYCPGFPVEASAPQWVYMIAGQANQR
jgi:uncharacterized protein YqjF (DUF2071 family)